MTLIELAERCEQATGRDLEIDVAIGESCGFDVQRREPPFQTTCRRNFTACFCDARQLVPVGFRWALEGERNGLCYAAIDRPDEPNGPVFEGVAAEPELALAAAALRARAASADTRPQGGDATEIAAPFTSGAVPEGQTPSPSHRSTGE